SARLLKEGDTSSSAGSLRDSRVSSGGSPCAVRGDSLLRSTSAEDGQCPAEKSQCAQCRCRVDFRCSENGYAGVRRCRDSEPEHDRTECLEHLKFPSSLFPRQ